MLFKLLSIALFSSLICVAKPTPFDTFVTDSSFELMRRAPLKTAADQIAMIGMTPCTSPPHPGECATNVQAAPFLIKAMMKYGIYNINELAIVVGNIIFESVNLTANINYSPGLAGQGTRNMQSIANNLAYARSIPELKDKVDAITPSIDGKDISDDLKNKVRALVLPDQYSYASGAWYYTTQCKDFQKDIAAGGDAGFAVFVTKCIQAGSTVADDRQANWLRSKAAFGL